MHYLNRNSNVLIHRKRGRIDLFKRVPKHKISYKKIPKYKVQFKKISQRKVSFKKISKHKVPFTRLSIYYRLHGTIRMVPFI